MNELKALYDASAQDLRFGIGLMAHEKCEHIPVICIHYTGWPREVQEAVRDSMRSGVKLNCCQRDDGLFDLFLETRERAQLAGCDGDHTGIIRFPSWDARLEGIEPAVLLQFDKGRKMLGRFLLIVQTDEWAFQVEVSDCGANWVGKIEPRWAVIPIGG